ncbi:MAG: malectin domain-containing carbohydrate-binding protein, partial [Anaerolineae bacterium]
MHQPGSFVRIVIAIVALTLFSAGIPASTPTSALTSSISGQEVSAQAQNIVLSLGGVVQAQIIGFSSAFTGDFGLFAPESKVVFANYRDRVGQTAIVGTYPAGTELIFYISVLGHTYSNLDPVQCHVIASGTNRWDLWWEDIPGGGDRDYNDIVVRVELSETSSVPPTATPTPAPGTISVELFGSPPLVAPGAALHVGWTVSGGSNCSETRLLWDTVSRDRTNAYANQTPAQHGPMGQYFDTIVFPQAEGVYVKVKAVVDGTTAYSREHFIPAERRMNLGAPGNSADSRGVWWEKDGNFTRRWYGAVGGTIRTTSATIQGTPDQNLFQSQREGISAFNVFLSDWTYAGTYEVTLYFADFDSTSVGQRVFDVKAETTTAIPDLDVFAKVGYRGAYSTTFTATVSDGELNIEFLPKVGQPILNAIRIRGIQGHPQYTWDPRVIASTDDTYTINTYNNQNAKAWLTLGAGTYDIGIRFQRAPIPRGSLITAAYLEFEKYAYPYAAELVSATIYGEAAGNAQNFAWDAPRVALRPRTQHSQHWTLNRQPWTSMLTSPNIVPVIQEIVNRSDWLENNALALLLISDPSGSAVCDLWSFDGSPSSAPRLVVKYVPAWAPLPTPTPTPQPTASPTPTEVPPTATATATPEPGATATPTATPTVTPTPARYGGTITEIVFSPNYAHDNTVFVGTYEGLFKTTNGGLTWYSSGPRRQVTALAISPNYGLDGTLLVGYDEDGIYRSTNRGSNWIKTSSGLTDPNVTGISFAPNFADTNVAFAITRNAGFFKTINAGDYWFTKNLGLPDGRRLTAHAISPQFALDNVQFVGTIQSGIYKTVGSEWFAVNTNLNLPNMRKVTSLAISPCYRTDQTIFAALIDYRDYPGTGRIYRSTNGASTWDAMTPEGSSGRIVRLSPDYCNDQTVFVDINGRLFKSTKKGVDWQDIHGGMPGTVSAIGLSPNFSTDQTLFVAFSDGLYRSTDGGSTWTYSFWPLDPTPTPTASPTPTATRTPSPTPTATSTPTPTATHTPIPCADAYEPDNTFSTAKIILTTGDVQGRSFHVAGDVDYVKFVGLAGYRYRIWTQSLGGGLLNDTVLTLYDTDGITELAVNDDDPLNPPASALEWLCPATGTYFFKVSQLNPNIG